MMKLTTEKSALQRAISAVSSVVQKREVVPVFACLHLEARNGRLFVRATDGDMQASTSIACEVEVEGECLAPGGTLIDIAKRVKKDGVSFEIVKGELMVKAGRASFKLPTLPVSDFPEFNTSDEVAAKLHSNDLRIILSETQFAAGGDIGTQPGIAGVYIEGSGSEIVAKATNGKMLARSSVECDAQFTGVMIDAKAVREIQSLCERVSGDVSVSFVNNSILVQGDGETISARLLEQIDSHLVNIERYIPRDHPNKVTVNRRDIFDAISMVSIVGNDKVRPVKLRILDGAISVSAKGDHNREASDEVSAELLGEGMEAAYNATYLTQILSAIDAEEVVFSFTGNENPTNIAQSGDDACVYVVMPMRV